MKLFKKTTLLFFILFAFFATAQQQTDQNNTEASPMNLTLKFKFGISTLELENSEAIEGNVTQSDFVNSSRISKNFFIDYGFRFSNFRANYFGGTGHQNINIQSLAIPVTINYFKDLNSIITLSYGLGASGNYIQNAKMGAGIEEKNLGINFGLQLQSGITCKASESVNVGIMIDYQGDLNKVSKDGLKLKQTNTSLISLNFSYKL